MSDFEDWKNKERGQNLAKKFGFKFDLNALTENKKEYDLDENANDRIFAPNHYCAHHVRYEGRAGQTVDHNWSEELQEVTQYDIKFEDGTVVRDVPVNELEIIEANLAEAHGSSKSHPPAKRDTKKPMKKDTEDADGDGDTDEEIPAYVGKGDAKKKKKSGKGKVPPQFEKHIGKKKKKKDLDEDATQGLKNFIREQVKVAMEELKNES
tara:strand:+ start:24259 stop:24885 length:627 start_codon:yes stop_codon:yes gene_type:complete